MHYALCICTTFGSDGLGLGSKPMQNKGLCVWQVCIWRGFTVLHFVKQWKDELEALRKKRWLSLLEKAFQGTAPCKYWVSHEGNQYHRLSTSKAMHVIHVWLLDKVVHRLELGEGQEVNGTGTFEVFSPTPSAHSEQAGD
jgi:hypothetical protein